MAQTHDMIALSEVNWRMCDMKTILYTSRECVVAMEKDVTGKQSEGYAICVCIWLQSFKSITVVSSKAAPSE